MIDPGLRERVALLTGANQGIGAAAALALAQEGAQVFITYLKLGHDDPGVVATALPGYAVQRAAGAEGVLEQIRSAGGKATAWEVDLADPAAVPALFERVEAELGPVEILFNNADAWVGDTYLAELRDGYGRQLQSVTAATFDHSFNVNSRAAALLIAEYARRHVQRAANWGRIISMTTGGAPGFPGEVSYGASKNALESYTMAAALELGRYGITANVLCPPVTDTGWITPDMAVEFAAQGPLYHVGQPAEVAEVLVFICSQQARYLTGQRIVMH